MNCRRVINQLSAYIDGEMTGEEMLAIRRHLSNCDDCAEEHRLICMTKQALSNLRNAVPREEFAQSIIMYLDDVQIPRYQKVLNSFINIVHQKLSPVAAALAVSGIALAFMSAAPVRTVVPQVASNQEYMTVHQTRLLPEPRNTITTLHATQPLKLASESPTYSNTRLELVSLVTR